MSPSISTTIPYHEENPMALAEERAALESIARRNIVAQEIDVAGVDDDEHAESEDDDNYNGDDVPTDEEGYELDKVQAASALSRIDTSNGGSDTEADTHAAPDVSSDRIVPSTDAEPEGSLDRVKSAALGIQQIEDLEDDAKGG